MKSIKAFFTSILALLRVKNTGLHSATVWPQWNQKTLRLNPGKDRLTWVKQR